MKQSLGVVLNYPKLLKQKLNDLDYEMRNVKIISDAIEFNEDSDLVTRLLEANYEEHYGKWMESEDNECQEKKQ